MRVILDTCIIMDTLQNREPFAEDTQTLFKLLQINGLLDA